MAEDKLLAGESVNIEYKVAVPEKSEKYMKTVVAFANGRGGKIIFGIEDKTLEVVGINADSVFQTMDAITNAIADSCEPKVYPDITLQTIKDKTVIVVEIPSSPMRPYYLKNKGVVEGTYIRVAGTSRRAEDFMLKELILEGRNRYFDSEPCAELQISEKDVLNLCQDMKNIALKHTWNESEKVAVRDITPNTLLTWGIVKEENNKFIPTNAYALLTGRMMRQPVIQCAVFKGINRAYFIDRREFGGPIQDQVEAAFQYVLEKINLGMKINGVYRQDVYELPVDSVRELIANAVAHRSYLEPGNIQIGIFDDRLEVTSPGMLLNTVSIQKMIDGYSKLRNPAIANAFAYMKIIEKWGTGIPRIISECKEYGMPAPQLIDCDGDFRVNLFRRIENTDVKTTTQSPTQTTQSPTQTTQSPTQTTQMEAFELSVNDKNLLRIIEANPVLTQKELAVELGWTVDRVKYYLNKMKKYNIIKRIGTSHNGYWDILIKF